MALLVRKSNAHAAQPGRINHCPDPDRLAGFFREYNWLLNGMFIGLYAMSMGPRQAITAAVAAFAPERVLDFRGGSWTSARLSVAALPIAKISICEP